MDEVLDFCTRVLGPGAAAQDAAQEAMKHDAGSRMQLLCAAARACRTRAEHGAGSDSAAEKQRTAEHNRRPSLASAVARELATATASLPERHREALALRESLGLSHAQIAAIMEIEPAAVAPLMARARLQLRAQRRGGSADLPGGCDQRDRALRLLALRQDSEPLSAEEDDWLYTHLGSCADCRRAHGAMLEASACFRAWRLDDGTERGEAGRDRIATRPGT